jgi:uncharacterized protein (TIGR00255 family)
MLAERSDVAEELTRLQSHIAQMAALLRLGNEPVGRRIEFLLQEMGREVNTLGSKTTDLTITASGSASKRRTCCRGRRRARGAWTLLALGR